MRDFLTVVSGLPRSGTSMMMQILQAGGMPVLSDEVRVPDADNPRGYYELEAVKRTKQDPSWLADSAGKAVKMVHLLLMDLPMDRSFRVLFMQRELSEVLASQRAMLRRQGKAGAMLNDEQLAGIFTKQMRQIEDWVGRQGNFALLRVPYAEVVAQPTMWAERIDEFLGGGLDTLAMAKAVDPALRRQVAGR
jgi:hypothetical protein